MPSAAAVDLTYEHETYQEYGGISAATPTGAVALTQIVAPVPQEMLLMGGANSNSTVTSGPINSVIWTVWTDVYTNSMSITAATTASTMTITNQAAWGAWNLQVQNAILTATSNQIGQVLTASTGAIINNTATLAINAWGPWNARFQENLRNATPEQVAQTQARYREQQDRYREQQAQIQVERSAAEKRAELLLQEVLSPKQREELAAKRYFTMETIAKTGERRIYRIHRGRSRNVEQVDESGRRIKMLCAHPVALVPDPDTMIAQKFMLETQEEDFLRIANHS